MNRAHDARRITELFERSAGQDGVLTFEDAVVWVSNKLGYGRFTKNRIFDNLEVGKAEYLFMKSKTEAENSKLEPPKTRPMVISSSGNPQKGFTEPWYEQERDGKNG